MLTLGKSISVHDNIQFFIGDTLELEFACHEADGVTPLDLTSAAIEWKLAQISDSAGNSQTPVDVLICAIGTGITISDPPTAGICVVKIYGRDDPSSLPNTTNLVAAYYRDQIRVSIPLAKVTTVQATGLIQALQPL